MKKYFKSISILILALSFFHLFSTIQVYLSDIDLLNIMSSVRNTGYLLMPNAFIMGTLKDISVAFAGGVSFTLSVGTLTVLISFLSSVLFFSRSVNKKYTLCFFALFLLFFVFFLNKNGICLVESFSFVLTPVLVFILYYRFFPKEHEKPNLTAPAIHFIPVVILAGFLLFSSTGTSGKIFSDFRDNFLMSNKAGMTINEFYYDYTLYPARVFKPYMQRIPKVCRIKSDAISGDFKKIEYRLQQNDYLVVGSDIDTDIVVVKEKEKLKIVHKGRTIVETSVYSFITQSRKLLEEFSQKTDKYGFYRQITGISLKTGFPLFMYILMHFSFYTLFSFVAFLLKKRQLLPFFASAGCLVVGLFAFGYLFLSESYDVSKESLTEVLKSKNVKERIAGLRFVADHKLDLSTYSDYDTMLTAQYIPEKYWFARSLGNSSDAKTYDILLELLGNTNQNVVCQALYSLGIRRNKDAVPVIIDHIKKSKDWYVQWYAYQALKRLRWKQKK